MILRSATIEDLNALISWIKDNDACKLWAGTLVRFPLSLESLKDDLEFSGNNTFAMIDDNRELFGLGQLLEKENGRIHMARLIVSPIQRGKGFGDLLCRLLIDEGIKRFGEIIFSLNVYPYNTKAVSLYKKLGFKRKSAPPDSITEEEIIHMILNPDHTGMLC